MSPTAPAPDPQTTFSLWLGAGTEARRLAAAIARLRTADLDAARDDASHPSEPEARALAILESQQQGANSALTLLPGEARLAPQLQSLPAAIAPQLSASLAERPQARTQDVPAVGELPGAGGSWRWPLLSGLLMLSLSVWLAVAAHWYVDPFAATTPGPGLFGGGMPKSTTGVGSSTVPIAADPRSVPIPHSAATTPSQPPPLRVKVPVSFEPASATLVVDGQGMDVQSGMVELSAGRHRMSIALEGYQTWLEERDIALGMGPIQVQLQPDPAFTLTGAWTGAFDEKPMTLQIVQQDAPVAGVSRLRAQASVDVGDGTSRTFDLTGRLVLGTRSLELTDAAKGYSFTGTMSSLSGGSHRFAGSARRQGVDYDYGWWVVGR